MIVFSRFNMIPACDRETNRQTKRLTSGHNIYCTSITSRGKKWQLMLQVKRYLCMFTFVARKHSCMLKQAVDIKSESRPKTHWRRPLGYSRSVMDQCQASDSPGELLRLAVIEGRRYGPLQPMRYDDDDDDTCKWSCHGRNYNQVGNWQVNC